MIRKESRSFSSRGLRPCCVSTRTRGLRTFCDIDILIPPEKADRFKKVVAEVGYKPSVVLNSPEEEEVWKFESHLPAIRKEEGEMDGVKVYHLSREHCVIHMLLHFEKHLRTEGNLEIKSLVDVLHAIKTWNINPGTNEPIRVNPEHVLRSWTGESRRIDWGRLWNQARRWKVQEVISPVVATLNHYWQAGIPASEEVTPLDLRELIPTEEELQKIAIQRVPAGFLHRLSKARKLPGFGAKMRFLFHIFFPIRENLYWRYGLSTDRTITSYYLFHLSYISKRFFSGVGLSIATFLKATSAPNALRDQNKTHQITK